MTSSQDSSQQKSYQEALQVIQQGVWDLANWSGLQLGGLTRPGDSDTLNKAKIKKLLKWPESQTPQGLRVLFDAVKLGEEEAKGQTKEHFWKPIWIANQDPVIPYPKTEKPKEGDFEELKQQIRDEVGFLVDNSHDWQNLSLLTVILEKFGSFISYGKANVALVDIVKTTAAVAAAIVGFKESETANLSLVVGDLSGIQKFIYTISSDGALKSLRARSFYLELVTEEIVAQLLQHLELPRTNVIYAGGGNIYILAPGTDETKNITKQVRLQFNEWLLNEFQGKVYLALDSSEPFSVENIGNESFSENWSNATKNLANYKARKFSDRIEDIQDLIAPKYAHTPCQVCHRDDVANLKPLHKEADTVMACSTCRSMYELGEQLFRVDAIVRQKVIGEQEGEREPEKDKQWFKIKAIEGGIPTSVYYKLVDFDYRQRDSFERLKQSITDNHTVLLVNNWDLKYYKFRNCVPILLGNYGKTIENESRFLRAEEMAEIAQGIKRVGYLRMDVDRLGQIFAKGLGKNQTLPRLAGLSRQMSYFFKVYLNSLAKNHDKNIPENIKQLPQSTQKQDKNILFIYAGGDDLFVSGAWNEVVDFGFDIYQCFRAHTGNHPHITLSAGVSISEPKFPLYQAATESGEAESLAKGNGRDSFGLFNQVFKWDEWLGIEGKYLAHLDRKNNDEHQTIIKYLQQEIQPKLWGILPFVKRLESQNIGADYSRNFVRNLLITAQMQEQALKKIAAQKKQTQPEKTKIETIETRYYLHLPKIAYTLARLPQDVLKDDDFRKSLKNPYNAPYFRAIATWIELLNRTSNKSSI